MTGLNCIRNKIWIFSILDALDGTYFLVCIFSDIFLNLFYLHDWETRLADNKILVLIMSLVVFWALSFASMRGMKFGKYFTSVGALGSVVPRCV